MIDTSVAVSSSHAVMESQTNQKGQIPKINKVNETGNLDQCVFSLIRPIFVDFSCIRDKLIEIKRLALLAPSTTVYRTPFLTLCIGLQLTCYKLQQVKRELTLDSSSSLSATGKKKHMTQSILVA